MQNVVSHDATTASSSVCIANIGPKQRKMRLFAGIGMLAVGVTLAAILLAVDADRLFRLAAFLPFWWGGISLFQVTERTCVALAAKGVRNMDDGDRAIVDPAELSQVKRQARRVQLKGLALGVALTALLLMLP